MYKRTFTHIEYLINCLYKIIQTEVTKNKTYNIGGETYTLYDVAKKISYKFNSIITFQEWPEFDIKIESGSTIFDSQKLEKDINYINYFNINDWIMNVKL
jgi:UDP-glucose 4-epimerase